MVLMVSKARSVVEFVMGYSLRLEIVYCLHLILLELTFRLGTAFLNYHTLCYTGGAKMNNGREWGEIYDEQIKDGAAARGRASHLVDSFVVG